MKDGDDSGPVPERVKFQVFVNGLGICAAPLCNERSVHQRTKLAECAHIYPRKVGSHPREDYITSLAFRKTEANLLYLCEKHHKIIDNIDNAKDYPVAVLQRWKSDHEEWAESVKKDSPYLTKEVRETLENIGRSVAVDSSKKRKVLIQLLNTCRELVNRNRKSDAQVLLAQVANFSHESEDPFLLYQVDCLNARLVALDQDIEEAKRQFLELVRENPSWPEAMVEYIGICRDAPASGDEAERVESSLRGLAPDNLHLRILDWDESSTKQPLKDLEQLSNQSRVDIRLYELALAKRVIYADSIGEHSLRDRILEEWATEIGTSPRPLVFGMVFRSVDLIRSQPIEISDLEEGLLKIESNKRLLENRDPISPKDTFLQGVYRLKPVVLLAQMTGDFSEVDQSRGDLFSVLEDLYFGKFIYANLQEILGSFRLSMTEMNLIFEKIDSSKVSPPKSVVEHLFVQCVTCDKLKDANQRLLERHGDHNLIELNNSIQAQDGGAILACLRKKEDHEFALMLGYRLLEKCPGLVIALFDGLKINEPVLSEFRFLKILSLERLDRRSECIEELEAFKLKGISMLALRELFEIAFRFEQWDTFVRFANQFVKKTSSSEKDAVLHARLAFALWKLEDDSRSIDHALIALENPSLLSESNFELLLKILVQSLQLVGQPDRACEEFARHADKKISFPLGLVGAEAYLRSNFEGKSSLALRQLFSALEQVDHFEDSVFLSLYLLTVELTNAGCIDLAPYEVVRDSSFVRIQGLSTWFLLGSGGSSFGATRLLPGGENYEAIVNRGLGEEIEWPPDRYSDGESRRKVTHILSPEAFICFRAQEALQSAASTGEHAVWAVKMTEEDGSLTLDNLQKFSENKLRGSNEFFEGYVANSLPFYFLCKMEGGLVQALGKIGSEGRGFIFCNDGSQVTIDEHTKLAKEALSGARFYIDALSALMLIEAGLLGKVISSCSGLCITASVVRVIRRIAESLEVTYAGVGRGAFVGNRFQFSERKSESENEFRTRLLDGASRLEGVASLKLSRGISGSSEDQNWTAILPGYIMDPLRFGLDEKVSVLTDDARLFPALRAVGEKSLPQSFSSVGLIRSMVDLGILQKLDFYKYLGQLSCYRYHLLPVTVDDMIDAVLPETDGGVVSVLPENLEYFNLPLTLSEDYGISADSVMGILGRFLARIVLDDSISIDGADRIFAVAIVRGLSNRNRVVVARGAYSVCRHIVDGNVIAPNSTDEKLRVLRLQLRKFSEAFDPLIQSVPGTLRVLR
ncbi:hypothetical protein [Haloferula rosea]|uniref:HNH endonuclease n=1 Tax=Haloferula rosea TaxID=490093 RepID=A0A934RDK6_9BACT|nr:hypothetical protein [Haloferula rosea]MBK1828788.1 hypothetical protein [Haloferula rosea]